MKTAYIQSIGGASGDMLLGALLDAGLPLSAIHEAVAALKIPGVNIDTTDETRCEVRGTRALVDVSAAPRYSPQQMLESVANASALSDQTRTRAAAVLNALFAAEARVHGNKPDQIHLHELGTADTLVDVVGVVRGLEQLGIQRIYASPLVLGEATGPRRPGGYSNPAPATLEIIAAAKAPVAPERPFHANVGELTTPTGAALITTLTDEYRQPAMTLNRIGVGVGGKNPAAFPNVIRLWLGEAVTNDLPANPSASPAPTLETVRSAAVDGYVQEIPAGQPIDAPTVITSETRQSRSDAQTSPNSQEATATEVGSSEAQQSRTNPPTDHGTGNTKQPAASSPVIAGVAHQSVPDADPQGSAVRAHHSNPVVASEAQQSHPYSQPPTNSAASTENPAIARGAATQQSRSDPEASSAPEPTPPFARWQDNIILLETNLDNATGEQLGFAMEQLFAAGALDVWHTPIQMKKNRPGVLLSALGSPELENQLAEAFLRHTPTLGVRVRPVGRYVADRDTVTVETDYGPIRLKRKWLSGQIVSASPEHDDIAAAAQAHNLPWQTITNAVD